MVARHDGMWALSPVGCALHCVPSPIPNNANVVCVRVGVCSSELFFVVSVMASLPVDMVQEITMTVRCSRDRTYKFVLDGSNWPTRVDSVASSSPAHHAGLTLGDFLLTVNGRDVVRSPVAQVEAIISYSAGSPLTLKVARVAAKGGAVAVVQNKYQNGVSSPKGAVVPASGLQSYQQALGSALGSAQNALDILGLPPQGSSTAAPAPSSRPTPKLTVSSGGVQEVEVMLGNDSDLSSPPSSQDDSDGEYDPLLDFSCGKDSYTLPQPDSSKEFSRADMLSSVLKTNQALRKMKDLTESLAATSKPQVKTSTQPTLFSEATIHVSSKPTPTSSHSPPSPLSSEQSALPEQLNLSTKNTHPSASDTCPPPTHSMPTVTTPSAPAVHHERSSSPPPPVPPYIPSSPDKFSLSNQPAYQLEVKRQRHTYEEVMLDQEKSQRPPAPARMKIRGRSAKDQLPSQFKEQKRENFTVTEVSHKQKSFTPSAAPASSHTTTSSTSTSDMKRACKGLPENVHTWKPDSVNKWLSQLNPSLHQLYESIFMEHNITGHSLLFMNQSKLLSIGITTREHRVQLATAIARLRLLQEQAELKALSKDVSWL